VHPYIRKRIRQLIEAEEGVPAAIVFDTPPKGGRQLAAEAAAGVDGDDTAGTDPLPSVPKP